MSLEADVLVVHKLAVFACAECVVLPRGHVEHAVGHSAVWVDVGVRSVGVRIAERPAIVLVARDEHHERPRVERVVSQVEVQVLVAVVVQNGVLREVVVRLGALAVSALPVLDHNVRGRRRGRGWHRRRRRRGRRRR